MYRTLHSRQRQTPSPGRKDDSAALAFSNYLTSWDSTQGSQWCTLFLFVLGLHRNTNFGIHSKIFESEVIFITFTIHAPVEEKSSALFAGMLQMCHALTQRSHNHFCTCYLTSDWRLVHVDLSGLLLCLCKYKDVLLAVCTLAS